jgi:hypothetical protein
MSFAAESWAWDQQCGNGIAKSVLAYLGFRASRNTGEAWPSLATIVKAVEHGERPVRAAVKQLVKHGKVERQHRFAANGRCISTLYRLPVVAATAEATPADQQETPSVPTPADQQGKPSSKEDSTGRKEERAAPASPPPPPPPPPVVDFPTEAKEASRIEEEPVSAPEPEPEPEPGPEERQLAREAGFDPDTEVAEELRECVRGGRVPVASWQPTAEDRACAAEFGQDCDLLSRRFANHYGAQGRKLTLAQWSAKFRNWCLPDPRYPRRLTLDERIAGTHDHYAAMAQRFGMLNGAGLTMGGQP